MSSKWDLKQENVFIISTKHFVTVGVVIDARLNIDVKSFITERTAFYPPFAIAVSLFKNFIEADSKKKGHSRRYTF